MNDRIPAWVPQRLHRVLPGGEEWESDSARGNPLLAIRICRLATGPVARSLQRSGDVWSSRYQVPIADGRRFAGALLILLEATGREPSPQMAGDIGWIGLERYGIGVGLEEHELPVSDRGAFGRLVWELTRVY